MNRTALVIGIFIAITTTALAQPAFYLMGNVKPGAFTRVLGLSRDGSLAVGVHSGADAPFTWTLGGGRQDVLGQHFSYRGVSRDGSTMTGYGSIDGKTLELLRQRPGEVAEFLGIPNGYGGAFGFAASAHGDSIVGYAQRPGNDSRRAPFRWTQSDGFQVLSGPDLSDFSRALDVSDDGKTIVGNAQSLFGGEIGGFVWREGIGETLLPGSQLAEGVSANGRFIAGTGTVQGTTGPLLWTDNVPQLLGNIPGWRAESTDVSDDGNVVVGRLYGGDHTNSFIWTTVTGMMMAKDYLALRGIELPPGQIDWQNIGVSANGKSFGGGFERFTLDAPPSQGWVAVVPSPSAIQVLICSGMASFPRRRR